MLFYIFVSFFSDFECGFYGGSTSIAFKVEEVGCESQVLIFNLTGGWEWWLHFDVLSLKH